MPFQLLTFSNPLTDTPSLVPIASKFSTGSPAESCKSQAVKLTTCGQLHDGERVTAGSWRNGPTGFSWERRYRWQVSKEAKLGVSGEIQS